MSSKEINLIKNQIKSSPTSSTNSERDEDTKKLNNNGKSLAGESEDENMSGFGESDEDEDYSKNSGNSSVKFEKE